MQDRNKVAILECRCRNFVSSLGIGRDRIQVIPKYREKEEGQRWKGRRRGDVVGRYLIRAKVGVVLRMAATSTSTTTTTTTTTMTMTTTTTTTMSVATAATLAAVVVAVLQVGARNKGSLRGRRRWFVSFRVVPEWVRASWVATGVGRAGVAGHDTTRRRDVSRAPRYRPPPRDTVVVVVVVVIIFVIIVVIVIVVFQRRPPILS